MLAWLKYSNISFRISLSPFSWNWIPFFTREMPTPIYPKRYTFAVGFLFLQFFIDLDNGTMDALKFQQLWAKAMGDIDVADDEMGLEVSETSGTDIFMVERPEH